MILYGWFKSVWWHSSKTNNLIDEKLRKPKYRNRYIISGVQTNTSLDLMTKSNSRLQLVNFSILPLRNFVTLKSPILEEIALYCCSKSEFSGTRKKILGGCLIDWFCVDGFLKPIVSFFPIVCWVFSFFKIFDINIIAINVFPLPVSAYIIEFLSSISFNIFSWYTFGVIMIFLFNSMLSNWFLYLYFFYLKSSSTVWLIYILLFWIEFWKTWDKVILLSII